ncbi:hypothetical protein NQ317_014953 [Molorchus minor]|uniref:Thioredoxin domain-containing protein n=1 Tax=Molorchus minor TaxID=1323400 RepID=A0ABQ9JYT3_9CUCU|nr:hypothetical protein NQ317_014953 [Molorchus minor]
MVRALQDAGAKTGKYYCAKEREITLAKVDIDDLGELAAKYDVSTIPALVVFQNGKVTERLVGLQDEDKLNIWLDNVLKK